MHGLGRDANMKRKGINKTMFHVPYSEGIASKFPSPGLF